MTGPMPAAVALILVKLAHTVAWAFLAGCVCAVPYFAIKGRFRSACVATLIIFIEIAVLAANEMRCPLTDVAAHFTADRSANFDIYLPRWLAENNKRIFGGLFVVGEMLLAWKWSKRIRAASPSHP